MKYILFVLFTLVSLQTSLRSQDLYPCFDEKTKLYGFCNDDDQVIISYKYKEAYDFMRGVAVVMNSKNKYGAIDSMGKVILPFNWEYVEYFTDSTFAVAGKNYGIINKNGKFIIDSIYTTIAKMVRLEDRLIVEKDSKYGIINYKGESVFPFYKWVDDYSRTIHNDNIGSSKMPTSFAKPADRFRALNDEGKMGIFNFKGETLYGFKYQYVNFTSFYGYFANDSILLVGDGKQFWFVNSEEKNVFKDSYFTEVYFNDYDNSEPICVMMNSKVKFIDVKNKILPDACPENLLIKNFYVYPDHTPSYRNQNVFQDTQHKQGVIDTHGNILIPFLYDRIRLMSDYAIVEKNNTLEILDLNNKTIMGPFENISISTVNGMEAFSLYKTVFKVALKSDLSALYSYSKDENKVIKRTDAQFEDVYLSSYDEATSKFILVYTDKDHSYNNRGKLDENFRMIK